MRLLTFEREGLPRPGLRDGETVIDLCLADPELPSNWPEIFATDGLERVQAAASKAPSEARLGLQGLDYLPVIPQPAKMLCVGLNYHSHAVEVGVSLPEVPVYFIRLPESLVGHGQPMILPRESEQLDYEAELAIVIGRRGRRIEKARALEHVAGYTIFNDGSIRDYQLKVSQWTLGKNFARTGPLGPEIVTPDELPEGARGLAVATRVNGETLQDGNTADMIFGVAEILAHLSTAMTLEPGDVIATGTPPGVGLGRKPPRWLKAGETIEVEIEGIGVLSNPIRRED